MQRIENCWEQPQDLLSDESEEEDENEPQSFSESREGRILAMMGQVDTGSVSLEELKKGFAHFVRKEYEEMTHEESKERSLQSKTHKHLEQNVVGVNQLEESEYQEVEVPADLKVY